MANLRVGDCETPVPGFFSLIVYNNIPNPKKSLESTRPLFKQANTISRAAVPESVLIIRRPCALVKGIWVRWGRLIWIYRKERIVFFCQNVHAPFCKTPEALTFCVRCTNIPLAAFTARYVFLYAGICCVWNVRKQKKREKYFSGDKTRAT